MLQESLLLLLLQFTFQVLRLLLPLNDTQEVIALALSLLSHNVFLFAELNSASLLKVFLYSLSLFSISIRLDTGLAIMLLTGTLSSKLVDLALAVVCLFLKLTETLKISLLFGGDANSFFSLSLDNSILLSLVLNDLKFKCFLFFSALSFQFYALGVTSLNFFHALFYTFSLNDLLASLSDFVFLNVSEQKFTFLNKDVLLSLPLGFSLLNLINNFERASFSGNVAFVLTISLGLQVF
jgi:hypothetical protein